MKRQNYSNNKKNEISIVNHLLFWGRAIGILWFTILSGTAIWHFSDEFTFKAIKSTDDWFILLPIALLLFFLIIFIGTIVGNTYYLINYFKYGKTNTEFEFRKENYYKEHLKFIKEKESFTKTISNNPNKII